MKTKRLSILALSLAMTPVFASALNICTLEVKKYVTVPVEQYGTHEMAVFGCVEDTEPKFIKQIDMLLHNYSDHKQVVEVDYTEDYK